MLDVPVRSAGTRRTIKLSPGAAGVRGTRRPVSPPTRVGTNWGFGRSGSMLAFPIRIVPCGDGGVTACFPDVPEAQSRGADEDEAVGGALAALEKALAGYVADGRPIPAPSDICGAPTVETTRFSLLGLE